MTAQYTAPEPYGNDWRPWARRLNVFLNTTQATLVQQTGDESASEDGVIMFDRATARPVISQSGAFNEVVVKQSAPASSVGASGDIAGMVSWDTNYIYVCTAAYDGTTNIWKRVALTGGAW